MTKNSNNGENQLDEAFFSMKKILLFLFAIIITAFAIRIYFLNFEVPLTNDALNYFFYGLDIKINSQLPENYSLANPGWGIFLSMVFSNFESQSVIDYMNLQKILSISFSVITVLPTYLLCKKFFKKSYSLLGALIIGLEPHLIQNSLFGISDSLYIFLIVISFLLYFNENKKITYISFALIAIATVVRAEGIFVLMVFLIMHIIRKNNVRVKITDIIISGLIFSIIFLPVVLIQTEINDGDMMAFGRLATTIGDHTISPEKETDVTGFVFIFNGIQNFPQYLGWSLIPILLPFAPIGFVLMFKNWHFKIKTVFTGLILRSIPAFYAYSIPLQDVRYLFFVYPLFVILSLITIEKITGKFNSKIIVISVISFVIISSGIYSGLQIDNEQINENVLLAETISKTPKVINDFSKSEFLEPMNYPEKFNEFEKFYEIERMDKKSVRYSIVQQIPTIPTLNYDNIRDFISNNKDNVTHLIVENDKRSFFYDIFINEEKYPYLEKEFDFNSRNDDYSTKIFRINYEKFF